LRAGYKIIEIHAAHGYLFHSFLSPLSNRRTDRYGGSFDKRTQFLSETVRAIREVWPLEFPLFVRVSATDWVQGGWTLPDTVQLAKLLRTMDVDVIDCSSGGNASAQKIPVHVGYQITFAETVRKEADIKTVAIGLLSEPRHAEEILANGRADLVAIGRMALWDPYWPHHAARELKEKPLLPIQYARSDIFA
jgi:2,4-dienoyl-CoA reductase-like NADH-dependent reductase (Old Yellow Enzyme family)